VVVGARALRGNGCLVVWADSTGYTKRKAMEKMDERKRERVERQKESLGMAPRRRR